MNIGSIKKHRYSSSHKLCGIAALVKILLSLGLIYLHINLIECSLLLVISVLKLKDVNFPLAGYFGFDYYYLIFVLFLLIFSLVLLKRYHEHIKRFSNATMLYLYVYISMALIVYDVVLILMNRYENLIYDYLLNDGYYNLSIVKFFLGWFFSHGNCWIYLIPTNTLFYYTNLT